MKEESEIFEIDTAQNSTSEPVVEMTPQPKKKKRVLSAEQREKLLANLKKGRETALLNRQKKAYVKKQAKKQKEQEIEDKIVKNVMEKKQIEKKPEPTNYNDEINSLKSEIEFLKKSQSKPKEVPLQVDKLTPVSQPVKQPVKQPEQPVEHIISTFNQPFW